MVEEDVRGADAMFSFGRLAARTALARLHTDPRHPGPERRTWSAKQQDFSDAPDAAACLSDRVLLPSTRDIDNHQG